ncbi:hypothetical protein HLB44_34815 [Aquincola sp. S2]|uniref:Uncharacterized protein n=1 Tax=Pseudaquabacterium terrae TaxID=2732868 RepID=A0ABX2ETX5_9BURK|nr:hypothetical protein [Aquabacterium terrae]NRF72169.1 hypothetical protein [Aquabacterium terrae]
MRIPFSKSEIRGHRRGARAERAATEDPPRTLTPTEKFKDLMPLKRVPAGAPSERLQAAAARRNAPPTTPVAETITRVPRQAHLDKDRLARTVQQALQRVGQLFPQTPTKLDAADLQEAKAVVDADLEMHGDVVPEEVRSVMTTMVALMAEVDRAIPHGRGNVLVRAEAGEAPDMASTFEKRRLKNVGDFVVASFQAGRRTPLPPSHDSALRAAASILVGAGGCGNYVHLFALKLGAAVAHLPELKGRIEINLHREPRIQNSKEPLDHAYGTLRFKDDGGITHDITFDPWADKNRVVLSKHSPFLASERMDGGYLLAEADRAGVQVDHYVKHTGKFLATCAEGGRSHIGFSLYMNKGAQVEERTISALCADAGKQFTLQSDVVGFVDFPVNNAAVDGTVLRRRSLVPANQHPLLENADLPGSNEEPPLASSSAQ